MSEIRINVNDVITSSSTAKQQLYEIQTAKSEITRLQSQLSMDVKTRYNISEQINRLIAQFDELHNDTAHVISTIESGANYYNQTENQLVIKAYLVGLPQDIKNSTMADNVGWIDDGRGDVRSNQNVEKKDAVLSDAEIARIFEMHRNGNTDEALVELGVEDPSQVTEEERNYVFGYLESLLANSIQEGIVTSLENADDLALKINSIILAASPAVSVKITNGGNKIANFMKSAAGKVAVPVVGGIVDCIVMVINGDETSDAVNKAIIHTGVAAVVTVGVSLALNAKTGAFIGSAIGSVIPGAGTAAGAAVGAVAGVVIGTVVSLVVSTGVNYKIDQIYDDAKKNVIDTTKKISENIGNAWKASWRNLGSAFG